MLVWLYRSFEQDHGHYISVKEIEETEKKLRGAKVMKIDHSLHLNIVLKKIKLNILGFWIFLGAEIMLFATLFAIVFHLV